MPRKMSTIDQAAKAANWYQNMAVAMRERDKCLAAIERWQTKLAEAEEHIRVLASQVGDDQYKAALPPGEPAPADPGQGVDPNWSESAE
jgi:uncharacterized protein YeaC (DUF1315 family)